MKSTRPINVEVKGLENPQLTMFLSEMTFPEHEENLFKPIKKVDEVIKDDCDIDITITYYPKGLKKPNSHANQSNRRTP